MKLKKITPPNRAEIVKRRKEMHKNHLDYFYGDYWCIYMDNENKCFLECDAGSIATKIETKQINYDDYNSLKEDPSSFKVIQNKYS